MRRQRNNQIIRELEGGLAEQNEFFGASHNLNEQAGDTDTFMSRQNSVKPGMSLLATGEHHHKTCIEVRDVELLGPDYCAKRPIFLPIHFPQMLNNQQAQQQAQ